MIVRIKRKNLRQMWYNSCIGAEFRVISIMRDGDYFVRDMDGYTNFIYKDDAEIVLRKEGDVH